MIRGTLGKILGGKNRPAGARPSAMTYDQAKALAVSTDPAKRQQVALDPDARPELLFFLARDAIAEVRAAVAVHPNTPRQADLLLALDESPEIRLAIAEKVTTQLESFPTDDGAQLWQLTVSILEALARDDLTRVRQMVAETVRGDEKVPKPVALDLARDREPDVAVPALGYPGRFEDEELIEIVRSAHDQRIVGAVAQRPRIGVGVSAVVVEVGDERAIGLLLGNQSAEIGDETFGRVVERAPLVVAWHEPLVRRADLPASLIGKIASFVSHALAELIRPRPKLVSVPAPVTETEPLIAEIVVTPEDVFGRASRLQAERKLTEDVIIEALGTEAEFVNAALSLKAMLPPSVIQKILASHSAKGMTALAWRAGCTMRLALQLQTRIGRLPPKARLTANAGSWPLTPDEMAWQIEFFVSLALGG